ncbi:MAG: MerR family DNA-binding transcriptional regulator [Desulfovibrio sp.]
MSLRIGELARKSGLTVRALRHYDAIGLLTPSGRSDAGYRLYDRKDVMRLHAMLENTHIPIEIFFTLQLTENQ